MTLFLTSSPTGPLDGSRPVEGIDTMNRFRENLLRHWRPNSRGLIIAADPEAWDSNNEMTDFFREAIRRSGFSLAGLDLMDSRYKFTAQQLREYDVILLGGGHVLTQNRYFRQTALAEALHEFTGIVIGISAGSMNCAGVVYNEPELQGEAVDPDFPRYLPGLGLTGRQIIPHFQMERHGIYDGLTFEEMNFPYSYGNSLLCLNDGSYLMAEDGVESLWGEAWRIRNGRMEQICPQGQSLSGEALRTAL